MLFTAANVPIRHRPVAGVSRTAPVVRRLVAMLSILAVAACGDSTGPTSVPVEGTYGLRSIEGIVLPATDGTIVVESGTLTLDGLNWELTIVVTGPDIEDFGTYSRSGTSVEFLSDAFINGDFVGNLSNGNRNLRAEYDLGGGEVVTLDFRK